MQAHVRFGSIADMTARLAMSALPPKADIRWGLLMSALCHSLPCAQPVIAKFITARMAVQGMKRFKKNWHQSNKMRRRVRVGTRVAEPGKCNQLDLLLKILLVAEGEELGSNGLLSWSVRKPTWECDWNPTAVLNFQWNSRRRKLASLSPEGDNLRKLALVLPA